MSVAPTSGLDRANSGTTYFWAITASDGLSTSLGPTWRFATVAAPPIYRIYLPHSPNAPDGANDLPPFPSPPDRAGAVAVFTFL